MACIPLSPRERGRGEGEPPRCLLPAFAWPFEFVGTNHTGIRRFVSAFLNISEDWYLYTRGEGISIARFREIIRPFVVNENPDTEDLATALLDSVAACRACHPLRDHVRLLNL